YFVSMFPPHRLGATVECSPRPAGATPSVPGDGRDGSVNPAEKRTPPDSGSPVQIPSHRLGDSATTSPKPGWTDAHPQLRGGHARALGRIDTPRPSPGRAALTRTGAVRGWRGRSSSGGGASRQEASPSCSSGARGPFRRPASPEPTSTAGSIALSHR